MVQEGQIYAPLRILRHTCNRPFSKTLAPTEHTDGKVVCPRCGSEEVERRWFYPITVKQTA